MIAGLYFNNVHSYCSFSELNKFDFVKINMEFQINKIGRQVDKGFNPELLIPLIGLKYVRKRILLEIEKLIAKREENQNGIVLMNL